ncbi:hypothetical protein CEXT_156471 [Caerostris extrusa]|uniref:Uncharacterized protein n=1 Tax=Caerostris extrusa TaxID=172846 RepID=A0AAV4TXB0_CAEEX|nr:hypothetical protein CEXT_156471 [Caerostris extrusa]
MSAPPFPGVETEAWVWRRSSSNKSTRELLSEHPETEMEDKTVHFCRILKKGRDVCSKGSVESLDDDGVHASLFFSAKSAT